MSECNILTSSTLLLNYLFPNYSLLFQNNSRILITIKIPKIIPTYSLRSSWHTPCLKDALYMCTYVFLLILMLYTNKTNNSLLIQPTVYVLDNF